MIIRITVDNLYSFKEETEFNMLPNKSQHMLHHKQIRNGISFLRFGALYGANGAGKTNLIKIMGLLVHIIKEGKLLPEMSDIKFKLSKDSEEKPSSVAVEFFADKKTYYYSLTFDESGILYEGLSESLREKDILIFERSFDNGKENITFKKGYTDNPKNKLFVEVLGSKLIRRDALLLSFLYSNYADEFADVKAVYKWFTSTLVIIKAGDKKRPTAQILDNNSSLLNFANQTIHDSDTGISSIYIKKEEIKKEDELVSKVAESLKQHPKNVAVMENSITGDMVTIVNEEDKLVAKKIVSGHKGDNGELVLFPFGVESDGTKRLMDYLPVIYDIINNEHVYMIDEIERSIHPMIIKEIISKISANKQVKGQLIFTTHESCLLDQSILRPDEIWFAQKNKMGSTQLYSLSDFNVHHTANIENGYLEGRYGAIPFLANLHDLHWEHE